MTSERGQRPGQQGHELPLGVHMCGVEGEVKGCWREKPPGLWVHRASGWVGAPDPVASGPLCCSGSVVLDTRLWVVLTVNMAGREAGPLGLSSGV